MASSDAPPPNGRLPGWYPVVRALILLAVGVSLLVHEALDSNPPRGVLIATALVCLGFSARDLGTVLKR